MSGAILGIDPGTRCGWALLAPESRRLSSGVWDLSPRRHEGGGMRYVRLRRLLVELFDSHEIAECYYEEVRRHLGTDAAHIYGGIIAVLAAECEVRAIPYAGVPVGVVKRTATGAGNAGKAEVQAAAVVAWSLSPAVAADEADALWIAEVGRRGLA